MKQLLLTVIGLCLLVSSTSGQAPYSWSQKVPGSGHGNSLCVNPINPNVIYGSPNSNMLWISRDGGNTWVQLGASLGSSGGIGAIAVNPLDTNQIIVAQRSSPHRIMKTTNNGQTWTQTWAGGSFNSYGVPLEHKPYFPTIAYVMGSSHFFRSDDFGSTWIDVATASFNAWCDAEISPLDSRTVLLGTVGSGIWKTTDGGVTWSLKHNNSGGEVPMIAWSPSDPHVVYATRWGGGNGIVKSIDGGDTWTQVPQIAGSMWSLAVSPHDPDYVVSCNYGTSMYITRNGGQNWTLTNSNLSGSGNGALVVDTFKVFALNGGIFKLNVPANVTGRNVRLVLSVNASHAVDYHNDYPFLYATGLWVKGELPVLGALQGNWTFADTLNNTLVRLYDDGTHGDVTPGDNVWTRSITVPAGTDRGQFRYKYGAAYPGIDTVNGGVAYLNNESAASVYRLSDFDDADTVLVLPTDRWETRGTLTPTDVLFNVDLRGGSDYYSGTPVSPVAQSVWLKGSLPVLGRMAGDWTFDDTVSVMTRMYDDGTHGDVTPGDKVWSRAITFPENTRFGVFSHRYSVVYPGVENNNGGVAYLNNESAANAFHQAALPESSATLSVSDLWITRSSPVAQVTPGSLDLTFAQGDSATRQVTISNLAELGSLSLSYSLRALDSAFENSSIFGSFAQTFTGAGRDRGNVYAVTRGSALHEIRAYLGVTDPTDVYFFVYESNSRTGTYTRVFQRNGNVGVGTKWFNSGPLDVPLRAGMFYYIGASWMGSVTYGKAPDSTFPGPIDTDFGQLLTAQPSTLAGYPPSPTVSGSQLGNSYAPYYQSVTVNSTPYITLSSVQGQVAPEGSEEISVQFSASGLEVGEYFPMFTVTTNDPQNPTVSVSGHVVVTPVVAVKSKDGAPSTFALAQNYPNPFNPSTSINYQLPVESNVVIRIVNLLGQQVAELVNTTQGPGFYQELWNGTSGSGTQVASGLYFYQLTVRDPATGAQKFRQMRKMILLK